MLGWIRQSRIPAARQAGLTAALLAALVVTLAADPASAGATICVTDDADRELCREEPARRIVALAPSVTELLFAAGAGDRVVAVVDHSDYPPAAEALARIGSSERLDLEALLAQEPDLVVAWRSGSPSEQLERLETLGLQVYRSEQRDFADIASSLERFGRLAGTEREAEAAARELREAVAALRSRYEGAEPVRYFYQVWHEPLMTVNDAHLISRAGALCGGENVFGGLDRLTPRIDTESVLDADPEAIVVAGPGEEDDRWLERWRGYETLTAVARGNLFFIPPSLIQRATPRAVEGARRLCEQLEHARERR